eukprot:scaffold68939_cov27-Prasinocladus_malaysianus.AAC.1
MTKPRCVVDEAEEERHHEDCEAFRPSLAGRFVDTALRRTAERPPHPRGGDLSDRRSLLAGA